MPRVLALLLVLALTGAAHAQLPGQPKWPVWYIGTTRTGEAQKIIIDPTLMAGGCTGTTCTFTPSANVTLLGQYIGDVATDFADPTLFDGRQVKMGAATSLEIPVQTGTQPTADGVTRLNDDLDRLEVGSDNNRTLRITAGPSARAIGGVEATNTFTYAGEVTSPTDCSAADTSCARTVCRCGICTGSNGSGTCTIDLNASFGRALEFAATKVATVLQVKSYTQTAGTVTIAAGSPLTTFYRTFVLRVRDDMTVSGGTLSVKGRGGAGSVAATVCTATTVGWAGGGGGDTGGGAGGANTGGTGSAGTDTGMDALSSVVTPGFWHSYGAGGGATRGTSPTNAAAPAVPFGNHGWTKYSSSGGGGGGASGSCSGAPGAGGAGAGMLHIEVGGKLTASSGFTIDATGTDGATPGGGGGGGGGVHVMVGELSGTFNVDTGTCSASTPRICVGGGAGGGTGTGIGAGGAGGDGVAIVEVVPR